MRHITELPSFKTMMSLTSNHWCSIVKGNVAFFNVFFMGLLKGFHLIPLEVAAVLEYFMHACLKIGLGSKDRDSLVWKNLLQRNSSKESSGEYVTFLFFNATVSFLVALLCLSRLSFVRFNLSLTEDKSGE